MLLIDGKHKRRRSNRKDTVSQMGLFANAGGSAVE